MPERTGVDAGGKDCLVAAGGGGRIRSYRDLPVWRDRDGPRRGRSMRRPRDRPQAERFGLVRQMRTAAAAIPANIAEGHRRRGVRAFLAFLSIAAGSHAELETHLELAARVGALTE